MTIIRAKTDAKLVIFLVKLAMVELSSTVLPAQQAAIKTIPTNARPVTKVVKLVVALVRTIA